MGVARPTAVAFLIATSLKLLLIPAYRSTDFEVHRNWLAITSSLPLGKWYIDATSEWTLDYPPFFAWFEKFLSLFAPLADAEMLRVDNLNFASFPTVVFQRCTVMVADLVLVLGALAYTAGMPETRRDGPFAAAPHLRVVAVALCAFSPGLIMVDHIHFQYNGLVIGIYLLSLAAFRQGRDLSGCLLFGVLLNFKHLFGFAAPVIALHLLARHWRSPLMLAGFALEAAVVGAASFGPFIALGQLQTVLQRLFPFGRGLTHAYWAPNAWALYYGADKAASIALRAAGVASEQSTGNLTGGLVGDGAKPSLLSAVSPAASAVLTLLAMGPALWLNHGRRKAARIGDPRRLPQLASFAAVCSFAFGWHVHEKAALMFSVPLGLDALDCPQASADYLLLAAIAHASLSPLLYEPREWPIKVLLIWGYLGILWVVMGLMHSGSGSGRREIAAAQARLLSPARAAFLAGLFALELYRPLHGVFFGSKLPFLPLLMTSVYCALGNVVVFTNLAREVMMGGTSSADDTTIGAAAVTGDRNEKKKR